VSEKTNPQNIRIEIEFLRLRSDQDGDLVLPAYHSELAAGMDIGAAVKEPVAIEQGEIKLLPTGFAVAIPPGYEIQVRPRSGLAIKHGLTVINAPGTIDADYRGEIMVGLVNLGKEVFTINRKDRIAQLILAPVCTAKVSEVEELDETERNAGGFGHTGI
jgi:dUTP pyrophosphatase